MPSPLFTNEVADRYRLLSEQSRLLALARSGNITAAQARRLERVRAALRKARK